MPWRVLSPCVYGRANHGCCCTAFNPAAFPSARPRFPSVGLARTPLVQLETTSAQPTAEPTRQGHGVLRECLCPLYRHALLAAPFPRRRADPLPRPVDRSAGLPQLRSPQRRVQRQHGPLYVSHSSFYATALPAGRGPYAGARFWTLRPPPARPGLLFPPAASLRGRRCTHRPSHTSSKAIQCMLTRSHPLVSADNACTVVRERPALNVTPLGGRSATDPGPSTTGGGLLFEGQAGAPKLGDPSVLGGAGAGGRDDTAGSGQSPPGGGGDATFNGATAQQS